MRIFTIFIAGKGDLLLVKARGEEVFGGVLIKIGFIIIANR